MIEPKPPPTKELFRPKTATEAAGYAVAWLSDFWDEVSGTTSPGEGKFIEDVFGPMFSEGPTGAEQEQDLQDWESLDQELQTLGILQTAFLACGYSIDAMKADKEGDALHAWQLMALANYWLGTTVGAWSIRKSQPLTARDFAIRGAASRHAENRAMKSDVFAWMDQNGQGFRSLDSAAEAVAGKVAPIKFRTAREWVGEWKKLRSTGTP